MSTKQLLTLTSNSTRNMQYARIKLDMNIYVPCRHVMLYAA